MSGVRRVYAEKKQDFAVTDGPFRMFKDHVVPCDGLIGIQGDPVRIQPGMKFHIPEMALFDPEL